MGQRSRDVTGTGRVHFSVWDRAAAGIHTHTHTQEKAGGQGGNSRGRIKTLGGPRDIRTAGTSPLRVYLRVLVRG